MVSSTTIHLTIPSMPPYETKFHGFNHLESGSLFSFGQACDHDCTAFFYNNSVKKLSLQRSILMRFVRPQFKVTAMHHHNLFIQCLCQLTHRQFTKKMQP